MSIIESKKKMDVNDSPTDYAHVKESLPLDVGRGGGGGGDHLYRYIHIKHADCVYGFIVLHNFSTTIYSPFFAFCPGLV